MIKAYTAFTSEIDDVDVAVSEILTQLEPEKNCLQNTVAIITCYYEFATSGVIAKLYKKLTFPIIGTTTTALATNHGSGQLGFSILMITSDDTTFTAACSSSLMDRLEAPLAQMYQDALKGHNETPKLILSVAPLMINHAGDNYVNVLNRVSGGVPNFGTLAIDDDLSYANSYVIFNDKFERDIYAIIVASGNINPQFTYASFSHKYVLEHTATITKSDGNILKEVNGLPLIKYLEMLGLATGSGISNVLHLIPFILDYAGEGIPVSRVLVSWTEEGWGICGGLMPEGTRFSIGTWAKEDVIGTTTRTIENILSGGSVNALILYSCLARSHALDADFLLEADRANGAIAERVPYIFAYSGGEICPVRNTANANSFHNNTVIACSF